jgi:DNA processing protein
MKPTPYALTLSLAPGIGPVKARLLQEAYPEAEALFEAPAPDATWPSLSEWKAYAQKASQLLEKQAEANIAALHIHDPAYPERLRHIPDAPILLFVKGHMTENDSKCLAVVGTRDPTPLGIRHAKSWVEAMQPYHCTIVSGLARGIDAHAHHTALHAGLPTWAVLAHGLHTVHPAHNRMLAERILHSGGCWISEAPYGVAPYPGAYPRRNRLIAGLSDGVLVIEAAIKSGAGITAHLGHQYNREVFALPGRIEDVRSQGCLDLIQRHVAQLVTAPNQITQALGWSQVMPTAVNLDQWPEDHRKIWQALAPEALRPTALSEATGISATRCLAILAELLWTGDIKVSHGWYAQNQKRD